METYKLHLLQHLSTYLAEEELFEKARTIPPKQRSKKWRSRLNMYDVRSQLALDYGGAGTVLNESAVPHKDAGHEVFAGRSIGAVKMLRY